MVLVQEQDHSLMICADNQRYYVYDEQDTENSELLRSVGGAHKEEITILRYSANHSLVATGSVDGEVVVWDFEMSKIEGILCGHTSDISGIEFVPDYPLMITSSMDSTVCVWGVRPARLDIRYKCILRYINISLGLIKEQETPLT
jgi:WD40 repeat protein